MKDSLNRKIYAQKIVDEIDERYLSQKDYFEKKQIKERENIIFAISGKWGEGKSGLLDLMEPLLMKKEYRVIRFNPWKYSQEDIGLKRAFLKTIARSLDSTVNLEDLYFDKSVTKIDPTLNPFSDWSFKLNIGFVLFLTLFLVDLFLFSFILSYPSISWQIKSIQALGVVVGTIFIQIIAPTLFKGITTERRSANVTTAEEFEEKFKELIGEREKIVIFIDDLDRCSSKKVKLILDSLKTFFIHPECSYVITGDHTVIEKYAGEELNLPVGTGKEEKEEEGRRFLKKLFDVYWRVPLATLQQFEKFIEGEIKNSNLKLNSLQKSNLINFLIQDDFFERNPRHVKRFISKLCFALASVQLQSKELEEFKEKDDKDSKDIAISLRDIVNNPDLLAKVLLIEECFYPLYEVLVHFPAKFIEHEKLIRNRLNSLESVLPEDVKIKLKEATKISSYELLLSLQPKFTNDENSVLHEVSNFFFFSGSTGLPSSMGPDDSKFLEYLKSGQLIEKEKKDKTLQSGTPAEKLDKLIRQAHELLRATSDENEKNNILSQMISLSEDVPSWRGELASWLEAIPGVPNHAQGLYEGWIRIALRYEPRVLTEKLNNPELITPLSKILKEEEMSLWNESAEKELEPEILKLLITDKANLGISNSFYLKTKSYKLKEGFLNLLDNPEKCKEYIVELKNQNITDGLMSILKEHLLDFLSITDNLPWVISNKDFLEQEGLMEDVRKRIIQVSNIKENIQTIVNFRNDLGFSDEQKQNISDNVVLLASIKNSVQIINDPSIISSLNKGDRLKIFNNYCNIIISGSRMRDFRETVGAFLLRGNPLWSDFAEEDARNGLTIIKKNINKRMQVSQKIRDVFISWNFS